MRKKVYVFGNNALAELLAFYLGNQKRQFDGYVLNEKYIKPEIDNEKKIKSIERVITENGAGNISVYAATAYAKMNEARKTVYLWLQEKGVEILSFVHPTAVVAENVKMGIGNIILENSTIQPFAEMGDGNIIWNNVSVCHHSSLGSFNYISPGATITGRVKCGNNNFFGANSTFKNDIIIGDYALVGAGTYVNNNLANNSVIVSQRSVHLLEKNSFDIYLR